MLFLALIMLLLGCMGCGGTGEAENADSENVETEENNVEESGDETESDGETEPVGETEDAENGEDETVEYPYDYTDPAFFNIENAISYAPVAEVSGVFPNGSFFDLPAVDGYGVQQGSCTDGTYAYMVLENQKMQDEETGETVSWDIVFKVDMQTWEVVDQTEPLYMDHGNDMAYNSKTNQLLVIHCNVHTNGISIIDAATMEFVEYIEIGYDMFSITYNESRDQYVIGVKGTFDFAILDKDFNLVSYHVGIDTGYVKQGMDCDDDYIYFVMYQDNSIICYNWDGAYCGCYRLRGSILEAESMFHAGDVYYIAYYQGGNNGGRVGAVEFDKSLLK